METKQQGSSVKKWLVSFVLAWNLILTMILGMGMIPKRDEAIASLEKVKNSLERVNVSLEKELQEVKSQLESALFGKEEAEKKVTMLQKTKAEVVKQEPEVIRIERKLTHKDSVNIANVMMGEVMRHDDSLAIYIGYIKGHLATTKSGVKPMK